MSKQNNRSALVAGKRWVVKIGSALLTANGRGLDEPAINDWVSQIVALRKSGKEILLVSSGAVAEGMSRMGWSTRPPELFAQQAAAAIGQTGLIHAYERAFRGHDLHTAQILLTHDDLANRKRYLNARSTLGKLLSWGVVPIINENDTVAYDELRFGDNDTLAAMVANLIDADLLVILTDQAGLYEADPATNPGAQLLQEVVAGDPALIEMASSRSGSGLGRGGMATKVQAASLAARSGAATCVVSGKEANILKRVAEADSVGTCFHPESEPLAARKQWLMSQHKVQGSVVLDAGAVKYLQQAGSSLLSVGVIDVQGRFERGDLITCQSEEGEIIAQGFANYSSQNAMKIKGQASEKIEAVLGYVDEPELIHRNNLVLL
ncbi:MAG: glutamate 5-kinase [Gammaproteobacteria bacterium]